MKIHRSMLAAAALALAAPAFAGPALASTVTLDFEGVTSFDSVGSHYANVNASFGVVFSGQALAVSNDGLGEVTVDNPAGNYYSNAPTNGTVMFVAPEAVDTVAVLAPVTGQVFASEVSFWYASTTAVTNAVQLWSGADGSGTLLGSINLAANATDGCTDSPACHWSQLTLAIPDVAGSITFASNGGFTLYDNVTVTTVPEGSTSALLVAGLTALGLLARRRRG